MKYLILISLLIFTGCELKQGVTYQGLNCKTGIKLSGGAYRCINVNPRVVHKSIKHDFKNPSWLNTEPIQKCETTITNIYKDGSVRCKGKILEDGKVSRVVNK